MDENRDMRNKKSLKKKDLSNKNDSFKFRISQLTRDIDEFSHSNNLDDNLLRNIQTQRKSFINKIINNDNRINELENDIRYLDRVYFKDLKNYVNYRSRYLLENSCYLELERAFRNYVEFKNITLNNTTYLHHNMTYLKNMLSSKAGIYGWAWE